MVKLLRDIADRYFDIEVNEIKRVTVSDYLDKAEDQLSSAEHQVGHAVLSGNYKAAKQITDKLTPLKYANRQKGMDIGRKKILNKAKVPATNEEDMGVPGGTTSGLTTKGTSQKKLRQGHMIDGAGQNAGIQKPKTSDSSMGLTDPTKKKKTAGGM